ncbi:MAG: tRNA (guanosine(37)-N1)-methyltransferase TrmD [bacterium]
MLKISIITLFPDLFAPHLEHLPLKRALAKELIQLTFVQLKDFAVDKRGTVDSPAYGGGPGMILRPEPIYHAIYSVLEQNTAATIIFLTPRGQIYTQPTAETLTTAEQLILVCGRYEGVDQRVIDYFADKHAAQEISIGRYVLSGGEVAAMAVVESTVRLIPGAIDNPEALTRESFAPNRPDHLEHPQYSRPAEWQGLKVPEILISGHHGKIKNWRDRN